MGRRGRKPGTTAEALVAWLRTRHDCQFEDGLDEDELARAEQHFAITFPPLWRAVLSRVHPISQPEPERDENGILHWTAYPDWRLRDPDGTRMLIDAPVTGLLFDVEHAEFWWHDWGARPEQLPARLTFAAERLAAVPRLVPLAGHLYIGATDDSPVFSIVQADLYLPAVTLADLPAGRSQDVVPEEDWPIGAVPFWSELHAYSQSGDQGRFAHLGGGGL